MPERLALLLKMLQQLLEVRVSSANDQFVAAILASAAAAAQARSQDLASAERLRKMGMVGDTSEGMLDLDAVLRARRNAS